MIINNKAVVSYTRASPQLLVCNLEGGQSHEFRGAKDYVDGQEQLVKRALGTLVTNVQTEPNPNGSNNEERSDDHLPLPVYNFSTEPTRNADKAVSKAVDKDDNHLLIPTYTFDRK